MPDLKLFIALLGGQQKDDKIEAHNFFAGAGETLQSLLPQIKRAWSGVTHVDAYMTMEQVDGYQVLVRKIKEGETPAENKYPRLMIYNIGYYKPGQFSEFHKLIPMVLESENDAWRERLKQDPDFAAGQALGEIARSHVDDKFRIDVVTFDADNVIEVQKEIPGYAIELVPIEEERERKENVLELGYLFVKELKEMD